MSFEFGDKVKDVVSGFEGIVIAKVQFITGADEVAVQARKGDGGIESYYFDVARLKLVKAGAVKIGASSEPDKPKKAGKAPKAPKEAA